MYKANCGWFNNAVSSSDHKVSNSRASNEMECVRKEAVVTYLKACPGIFLEELKKTRNTSVGTSGTRTEIWSDDCLTERRSANQSSENFNKRFLSR
jgi:hypothetical protein